MPWMGDGEEQGFLPNSIAEIINKKEGHQRLELEIPQKIKKTDTQSGLSHTSYFRNSNYSSNPSEKSVNKVNATVVKKNAAVKKSTPVYNNNFEYQAISRAQMYISMGDYRKALIELKPYIESENAAIYIAACYDAMGNKEKANEYYTKASEAKYNNAKSYVSRANHYMENNQYAKALEDYNEAIKMLPGDKQITDLRNACIKKIEQLEDTYFKKAVVSRGSFEYDDAAALLNKAIEYAKMLSKNCAKYNDYEKELISEMDEFYRVQDEENARQLFQKAKKLYNCANPDYKRIISLVEDAIDLSDEDEYPEFLDFVQTEYNNAKAEDLYNKSLSNYNDARFDFALRNIKEAIELNPDESKYRDLLNNAKDRKIDIRTCTKLALMTLGFISDDLAQVIIKNRDEGVMWYDYRIFAEQFNIRPHLWPVVEESIKFPLKQMAKIGRKIDF